MCVSKYLRVGLLEYGEPGFYWARDSQQSEDDTYRIRIKTVNV